MSIRGSRGGQLELGTAPERLDSDQRRIFYAATPRGGLFALVVEGVPAEERPPLFEGIRHALERDRGTPSSRLLRAVGAGCRRLEDQTLHRFELAGLGLTALLIEDGAAHVIQLPPSQAYVVEDGQVRAIPEEPMRGAAWVGSDRGRRWEVEIDVNRFNTRPGSAYVLCTAGLADRLTLAKVLDASRRPAAEGAAALHASLGADGRLENQEALIARLVAEKERPRARLFPIRERRPAVRAAPLPPPRAGGPRIEAWGLASDARTALRGRLGDPLPAIGRPRRTRRGAWLALPALAVVGVTGGAWWLWRRSQAPSGAQAHPADAAPAAPPPPAQSPSTNLLLSSGDPFTSLAVVNGVPRVLDTTSRIAQPGSAPVALRGAAPLLALAARETDAIALDNARTIWRLGEGGEPPRALALRAASLWQRPRAIATYAGNLYVLDAGSPGSGGQIWRHSAGAGGGFDGEAQAWIAPNAGVNLDGATGLAIDGSIWVSREDGAVLKLTSGRPEPFELRGVEVPIRVAGAVYTDRVLTSIYVLDAAERRLLKLAKTGQLEAAVQEVFPIGEIARGLWVEESGRRALVLTDRRLQEVALA